MITATRLRCQTCPDYINTLKGQLLTVVSKPLCQPWCFCSSWSKCIIFTLSCCHKHFGLRCSSEHLCYPARRHCSHIDERWWGTNCWNLDVILKLCRKGCGILYLLTACVRHCAGQRDCERAIDQQCSWDLNGNIKPTPIQLVIHGPGCITQT